MPVTAVFSHARHRAGDVDPGEAQLGDVLADAHWAAAQRAGAAAAGLAGAMGEDHSHALHWRGGGEIGADNSNRQPLWISWRAEPADAGMRHFRMVISSLLVLAS
jgi:hypothetical protein